MIVTVTLNPAIDVTYRTERLLPGSGHRVAESAQCAGGKGINVSRALRLMGHDAVAIGLAGGATGAAIAAELTGAGVPHDFVSVAGPSRTTVTIIEDSGRATLLREPGPPIAQSEWVALKHKVYTLLDRADVVVLAGSVPPGIPIEAYAELLAITGGRVPTVLDADGSALCSALIARPTAIKPNADELRAATGIAEAGAAARNLCHRGAGAVYASLGANGILGCTAQGTWRLAAPRCAVVNPTGAGDAAVAAIATGIAEGLPTPMVITRAVAWSAAAVVQPQAGVIDPRVVDAHLAVLAAPTEVR